MDDIQSQFTMIGMWNSMTPLGKGVIIVLLLMSAWSLTIAIERVWRFHLARKESLAVAKGIAPLLEHQRLEDAIRYASEQRFRHSHLARVLAAGLTEYHYERSRDLPPDFDLVDSGRRAIERESMMTTAEMRKGLGNLATISTTAPFIGLFGTVVGIITAFQGMAMTGSGGLGAVSAGISEALGATALGLFVAVPAVWMYNHFLNRIEHFNVEMTNSASQLVDYFIKSEARARIRA
jgi:biopolymer transport protein ExbB